MEDGESSRTEGRNIRAETTLGKETEWLVQWEDRGAKGWMNFARDGFRTDGADGCVTECGKGNRC
jgi:hypothetical protein